jgi:hypothetical protein
LKWLSPGLANISYDCQGRTIRILQHPALER